MDALETAAQIFISTKYGPEMKKSLADCFELIRVQIEHYEKKIQEIESKIRQAEGG